MGSRDLVTSREKARRPDSREIGTGMVSGLGECRMRSRTLVLNPCCLEVLLVAWTKWYNTSLSLLHAYANSALDSIFPAGRHDFELGERKDNCHGRTWYLSSTQYTIPKCYIVILVFLLSSPMFTWTAATRAMGISLALNLALFPFLMSARLLQKMQVVL